MAVEVAKGIQDHPEFKLGSIVGAGLKDDRTLMMAKFADLSVTSPASWDFDKGRKKFPFSKWGNDQYGDCELAGRTNYLLRSQRLQTKTTPEIVDEDVISLYKEITGCEMPGDNNDHGMNTLTNLGHWRKGWKITKDWRVGGHQTRNYSIAAYGLVDKSENELELHTAAYLFAGALLGCHMPLTCKHQTHEGVWDYTPEAGDEAEPGSWGGHCVYTKRYDADNVYVITWGKEIRVTNAWMREYCHERYVVIDSFDTWVNYPHVVDIAKMIKTMENAGIHVSR